MHKGRLEAFSDGVFAIIITIMVLELKAPHTSDLVELQKMLPTFLSYVLSFIYVGIYWNNHHHLFQAVQHIHGKNLWGNLHLLFWLSLIPWATSWLGENSSQAPGPVAAYGFILLCSGVAYMILVRGLLATHDKESLLFKAIGQDFKGKISVAMYFLGILVAFYEPWISLMLYIFVAILWLIPDQRIEKKLHRR